MPASTLFPILIVAPATAILVVSAAALGRAFGSFWGTLVAGLPVSVGPAYLCLAMQHDAGFIAASALSSCAANAATGLLLTTYGLRSAHTRLAKSLGLAIAVWLVASLAIRQIDWTPTLVVLVNLAVYGVAFILLKLPVPAREHTPATKWRWYDVSLRGVAVAGFVSAIAVASAFMGPMATGIAAVFPVSFTGLIILLHPSMEGEGRSSLAANALRTMLGFGIMLLVLHFAVPSFGVPVALLLALSTSIVWSAGIVVLRYRLWSPI